MSSMTLWTSDASDALPHVLTALGVARRVRETRPEFAERLVVDDGRAIVLLKLPVGGGVIVCGRVRKGPFTAWQVWSPDYSEFDLDRASLGVDGFARLMIEEYDRLVR
jgi:hypothetical protein